jgi:hypothetical protein
MIWKISGAGLPARQSHERKSFACRYSATL